MAKITHCGGEMKLNFKWKKNTAQYQTGESLYLNKIKIGGYGWNSFRSKSAASVDNDWAGQTVLPQATQVLYGKDQDEVKARIEHLVTSWFKEALVEEK